MTQTQTTNNVSQETPLQGISPLPSRALVFLETWKQGVELAGSSLFGCQASSPQTAIHWQHLQPRLENMRKAISNRSAADSAFIAAMASFFNDAEGQRLMTKAGVTFGGAAAVMSREQRQIISSLLINYTGW